MTTRAFDDPSNPELNTAGATPKAETLIGDLYRSELGRDPDAGGLAYWSNAYNTGMSLDDIRNQGFRASEEYQNLQQGTGIPETVLVNPPDVNYPIIDSGYGYLNPPEVAPQTSYSTTPPLEVLSSQVIPPGFDPNMRDEYGNIIGYRDPIRKNIPIDSRQLQSPIGEYYYPGDPRFSQIDPVRDFIQNIDQQLPYLQRVFQQQLQLLGDPVAAARAVLGSLR